ncbi:hypothetical protein [Ktedonobacter robiniae]|uniref:Amino acid permease n=1 Tax=Ktedonobacter robiniae TaxID=2778365 RepID=A0ABQ3UH30_9CHLR|nr:hypothetical protein [Ktedonobacter robiniae]GHO52019.1 hypothetical protein KSB_04940 [Ktedonobacter robiniae]
MTPRARIIAALTPNSTVAWVKFTEGAWVAPLAIGLFILVAMRIRRHYDLAAQALALQAGVVEVPQPQRLPALVSGVEAGLAEAEETPEEIHHLVIVPVASLDRASMRALAYAASLQQPVLALHLSSPEEDAKRFHDYWHLWGDHLPLAVIVSPYRAIVAPIVKYIEVLHWQRPDLTVTVILPEIVVRHWWHRILHGQTASQLRHALRPLPKIVVTTIPFHLPD